MSTRTAKPRGLRRAPLQRTISKASTLSLKSVRQSSRGGSMQDRHIGDVRVTRIEEQMGPGFPAKDFFPEFDADTFAAEGHWLPPSYYQPRTGPPLTPLHPSLILTGPY